MEKNSFHRNLRAGQACIFFRTLHKAGVFAFPRGDELTIESHFGDSIITLNCIAAIVYEFSTSHPWDKVRQAQQAFCHNLPVCYTATFVFIILRMGLFALM